MTAGDLRIPPPGGALSFIQSFCTNNSEGSVFHSASTQFSVTGVGFLPHSRFRKQGNLLESRALRW